MKLLLAKYQITLSKIQIFSLHRVNMLHVRNATYLNRKLLFGAVTVALIKYETILQCILLQFYSNNIACFVCFLETVNIPFIQFPPTWIACAFLLRDKNFLFFLPHSSEKFAVFPIEFADFKCINKTQLLFMFFLII